MWCCFWLSTQKKKALKENLQPVNRTLSEWNVGTMFREPSTGGRAVFFGCCFFFTPFFAGVNPLCLFFSPRLQLGSANSFFLFLIHQQWSWPQWKGSFQSSLALIGENWIMKCVITSCVLRPVYYNVTNVVLGQTFLASFSFSHGASSCGALAH